MSKEKTNSLLNCPFCGGEAKIDKTITNTVSVECTVCHASSRIILCTEGDIEQKAIKAWNTRKPMERIVERLGNKHNESTINYHNLKDASCLGERHAYRNAIEIVKEEGGLHEI